MYLKMNHTYQISTMSSLSNSNDEGSIKFQEKASEMTLRAIQQNVVPLADASESIGSGCFLNAQLNGLKISDRRYSDLLKDGMIICRFYHHKENCEHGFVVFQTHPAETFKIHIIGEDQSDGKWQIFVEIKKSEWRPDGRHIRDAYTIVETFKKRIEEFATGFNSYKLGFNDCRHFSSNIADYLVNEYCKK